MNADGTGRTLVTAGQPEIGSYRWSPDGRMIAFTYTGFIGDEPFEDLWVMQADGSGQIKVAADASTPSWSPDGRRVAYAGGGQIHIVTADGRSDVRVTNQPFRASAPAWSPDGTQIAFVTTVDVLPDRPAPKHIFLIRPDGTGSVDLTGQRGDDESPTWSPDGKRIAFYRRPGTPFGLQAQNGQGGIGISHAGSVPVEVRFSRDRSADDVLVEFASVAREKVLLITSDRELAARVRTHAGHGVEQRGRESLFAVAASGHARRRPTRYPASTAGLPKGANKVTEELKGLWLTDEEE